MVAPKRVCSRPVLRNRECDLLWERVFSEVSKGLEVSSPWITQVGLKSSGKCPRKTHSEERHKRGDTMRPRRRRLELGNLKPRMPGAAGSPRGQTGFSLRAFRGCGHGHAVNLDFWSAELRQKTFWCSSHRVSEHWLCSPGKHPGVTEDAGVSERTWRSANRLRCLDLLLGLG